MIRRDRSLSVRFLAWWVCAVAAVMALCAGGYFFWENRAQQDLLKIQTTTLAAVLAPRVVHDMQNHVASYAHRTLRAVGATQKDVSLSIYGSGGSILFSTSPVFRRAKELPMQVSQVMTDGQPRWDYSPGDARCQAFYPLHGREKIIGVLQISQSTRDLFWDPLGKTSLLVVLLLLVVAVTSGFLLFFLRGQYFKPLKELSSMLETIKKPVHHATPLEIPQSEFHGELASLYRNTSELARDLADARRTLENRTEVRKAVDKVQEENRFMARQIYERKLDRQDTFGGYEMLSKPLQMEKWGRLWKNAVAQGARKVTFSFWSGKSEDLKGVLQGSEWDQIFQDLVAQGKNLEEISDELFMEFGLDLTEWLLGRWDAYDGRLELLGNAWACQWDHNKESFTFLKDAKPLTGSRKQGFWSHGSFSAGDKLIFLNAEPLLASGGAGMDAFLGLLSKNIKSNGQNLMDLLVRELTEGNYLAPGIGFLLMIHSATQIGTTPEAMLSGKKNVELVLPPSIHPENVVT